MVCLLKENELTDLLLIRGVYPYWMGGCHSQIVLRCHSLPLERHCILHKSSESAMEGGREGGRRGGRGEGGREDGGGMDYAHTTWVRKLFRAHLFSSMCFQVGEELERNTDLWFKREREGQGAKLPTSSSMSFSLGSHTHPDPSLVSIGI